jgi:hypothetical protein
VRRLVPWIAALCAWQTLAGRAAAQDASPQAAPLAPGAQAAGAPERPAIAAVAGGEDDVTRSVLVGPGGQVYEPAAPGTWQRRFGGGIAPVVAGAAMAGQALFAHGAATPVFRLHGATWHAHPLPNRGPCALARGGAAALAIGRHVYTWRDNGWTRLASVPGVVTALWAATPARAHAVTAAGDLWRVQGSATAAVPTPRGGDDPVTLLAGHGAGALYGVTRGGAVLRIGARATLVGSEPGLAGWTAQVAAVDASGALWALGWSAVSGQAVLARTRGNVLIAVETLAGVSPGDRFVALLIDRRGGMSWATESGVVRYRTDMITSTAAERDASGASWRDGRVLGELPAPTSAFPGRGPARTR